MVSYKATKSSSEENARSGRKLRGVKARETKSSSSSCGRGRPPKSKDRREARSNINHTSVRPTCDVPVTSATETIPEPSPMVEQKHEPSPQHQVRPDDQVPTTPESSTMPQYIFYIPRVAQPMMGVPQGSGPAAGSDRVPGQHENYFYTQTQMLAPNQVIQTCHGSLQPSALAIPTRRCHNNIEDKLQDIVSAYIDFLLDENEDKTEISKSYAPPLDPSFEAEEYYQRIQRKRVTFPTRKFCCWLEENTQHNYQEVMDLISVVRGELPVVRFKEEYRQYANGEDVGQMADKTECAQPCTQPTQ